IDHKGTTVPTNATAGRLRLVRVGGEVSYFASDHPNAELRLLNQLPIGEQEMEDLRLIAFTGGPRATIDVRFSDLHIRMGNLPRPTEAPKPARPKGWLGTAAVLGMVLLLLVGLGLIRSRRRPRQDGPSTSTANNPMSGPGISRKDF